MSYAQQQPEMEGAIETDAEGCEVSYRSDTHLQMDLSAYLTYSDQDENSIQLPEAGNHMYNQQLHQVLSESCHSSNGQGQNLREARNQDWLQRYDGETNGSVTVQTTNLDDSDPILMNESLASSNLVITKSVSSEYRELSEVSKIRPAKTGQKLHDSNLRFGHQAERRIAEQGKFTPLKCNEKSSPHGPCARLYRVERIDQTRFDLEGKSMYYALIRTNHNVRTITGIGKKAIGRAQCNTYVKWGEWKIMYLGRETPRGHADQAEKGDIDTPATSSLFQTDYSQLWPSHDQKSSHNQSSQTCDLGKTLSLSDGSPCISVELPAEHGSGSTYTVQHTTRPLQSSFQPDMNGNGEATTLQAKRRAGRPVSLATRMKMQERLLHHAVSDTTRANQSLSSANARLYLVKRADGTDFEYEEQLVSCAIIRTLPAVCKFLHCSPAGLWQALHRKSKTRGIVKKEWIVEDQGKASISA